MMFGFLFMFLMMGLPVILVILLFTGGIGAFQYMAHSTPRQSPTPNVSAAVSQPKKPVETFTRYCPHCGAGIQPGWTHCPQYGAAMQ